MNETRKSIIRRRRKFYPTTRLHQVSIIFIFTLLTALISVLLSIYIASLPLQAL